MAELRDISHDVRKRAVGISRNLSLGLSWAAERDELVDQLDFQRVFDDLPTPLMLMDRDLQVVDANRAYLDAFKRTRDDLLGMQAALLWVDGQRHLFKESFEKVRNLGTPDVLPIVVWTVPTDDHGEERSWSCTHLPIRGADGQVAFILQNAQDVTDMDDLKGAGAATTVAEMGTAVLHRAEAMQAMNQTLRMEARLLRNLFMQSPSFVCLLRGPDHIFELVNEAFIKLVGERDFIGRPLRDVMPDSFELEQLGILDEVFATKKPFIARQMKVRIRRALNAEAEDYFLDLVCQPVLGASGTVDGLFIEGTNVTDHVQAEERQALLIRELHHRVRNTLATVQGVMNSTARTSETIEDYQAAFTGRISALARTHALLTEELQQSVPLLHLFIQELEPFAEGERVRLKGPWINLPSQIAVPLAMTIHELTTNAAKFGALANATGRLDIEWELVADARGRAIQCSWKESDGPAVTSPAREGFGSMLLNRVLMQQIGAEIKTAYDPAGFRLSMRVPLDIEAK